MDAAVYRRVVAIICLVGLLSALGVWYGGLSPAPEAGDYPDENDLGGTYSRYLGDRAMLSGRVTETTPVVLVTEYGAGETLRLTVTNLSLSAANGDRLRVYGVVEPNHTIRAVDAYTQPPRAYWYASTVSFLAGLWVLGRVVRYWRLDTSDWTFEPRSKPVTPRVVSRLRRSIRRMRK